jgi:hypothetical protein
VLYELVTLALMIQVFLALRDEDVLRFQMLMIHATMTVHWAKVSPFYDVFQLPLETSVPSYIYYQNLYQFDHWQSTEDALDHQCGVEHLVLLA